MVMCRGQTNIFHRPHLFPFCRRYCVRHHLRGIRKTHRRSEERSKESSKNGARGIRLFSDRTAAADLVVHVPLTEIAEMSLSCNELDQDVFKALRGVFVGLSILQSAPVQFMTVQYLNWVNIAVF
jgi:hypothetical protein